MVTILIRIDRRGVAVTATVTNGQRAAIAATVTLVNEEPRHVRTTVAGVVADISRPVANLITVSRVASALSSTVVELEGAITNPLLWRPDQPYLYTLTVAVVVDGMVRDLQKAAFGVRRLDSEQVPP